jgi:nicotinamide mononucleotide adenylyltransferase
MAEDKHIVFSFGRMNPPTAGHSKVIDKVHSHAKEIGANHAVVVSHSQNKKKDPLHHNHKKEYLQHIHPDVNFTHSTKDHPHFLAQLKKFNQEGHTHATMVVGSDRVKDFQKLSSKYNGKEYNYKKIRVISAGHRDPDAEGVTGISGTKMRNHATNNDYKSFKAGLHPNHNEDHARKLFDATKSGLQETTMQSFGEFLKEDMEGMSQKSGDKRSTESGAGMTAKGVAKYNRRTGGNLKTAVTTPPSKLKKGSKAANRRKSFCARSRGWTGERGKAARRRWNC